MNHTLSSTRPYGVVNGGANGGVNVLGIIVNLLHRHPVRDASLGRKSEKILCHPVGMALSVDGGVNGGVNL